MRCKDCGKGELVSFKVNMSRDGKSGVDFCRCPLCNREHRNILRSSPMFERTYNNPDDSIRKFNTGYAQKVKTRWFPPIS